METIQIDNSSTLAKIILKFLKAFSFISYKGKYTQPNKKTLKAMKEGEAGKNLIAAKDYDDLIKQLNS